MKNTIKIKTTFILKNFEEVSESQENKIVGGFSTIIKDLNTGLDDGNTNNCDGGNNRGGNCTAGCGGGQNIQCNQ